MREIVTVQVGSFSNFIGSHFWNFQDELLGLASAPGSDPVFTDLHRYLNMDVLYRSGETPQGDVSYTPRLLSIDYQGSLGSVSSRGTLYNDEQSEPAELATWKGNVSRQASEPHKRNLFLQSLQDEEMGSTGLTGGTTGGENNESRIEYRDEDIVENLDRTVEFWTDYSKVHYHPQSLYQLSGLLMDTQEFGNYGTGRDIYSEGQRGEEISERLRFFVEECDHIQGFQFIVDESGGFSAIAAEFLESVSDDYSNTPIFLYNAMDPCFPTGSRSRKQTVSRSIQDAVSFARLSTFSKLIMPVGLPFLSNSKASAFLRIQDEKAYYCSAVYAAALHSATLPFRMEQLGPTASSMYFSGAMDVNTLVQTLAGQARQNTVTIVDVAMPAPPVTGKQDKKPFLGYLQPLTPEIAEVEDLQAVESIAVQGALKPGGQRASVSEVTDTISSAYEEAQTRPQFCHLSVARCPLPVPLPFPLIFGKQIGQQGELLSSPDPSAPSRGLLDVNSIPIAARLRSSKAVLPFLECRLRNLRRLGIDRGAPGAELLCSWGFGKEDLEEIEESLYKMVTTLDERAEASSDSD